MGKHAWVFSLFLPGAGQVLLGQVQRGLLTAAGFFTALLMTYWRFALLAPREITIGGIIRRSLERRPHFAGGILLLLLLLWLLAVLDTVKLAPRKDKLRPRRGLSSLFIAFSVVFFVLGWQISEIDIPKMVKDFDKAMTPLARVLWPWEAALTRDTSELLAQAEIIEDTADDPPPRPAETPGKPYVFAEPAHGTPSRLDDKGSPIPGSTITLKGKNFEPRTLTEIWWEDPIGSRFQVREGGAYLIVETDGNGSFEISFGMPYSIVPAGAVRGEMVHFAEARQTFITGTVRPSDPLLEIISRMVETIVMGLMATLVGIVVSIPLSFLAARNIMHGSFFTIGIYYVVRFVMNVVRSIEPIIWAVIAVVWVGLGPFAGVIALTIHSIASLGKLYSEAIEGIDPGPIEAVQATGANKLQTIMYAVIPQMISPFVSFSIYRWDINVRMSTIIGMVGGGGVGFVLLQYVRLLDYRAAGIAVWFIAITVAVLDYVSAEIREKMN